MALAEIEQARVRKAMDAFMQQRRPAARSSQVGSWVPCVRTKRGDLRDSPSLARTSRGEARIAVSESDVREGAWGMARILAAARLEVAQLRTSPGSENRGGIRVIGVRRCARLLLWVSPGEDATAR